MSVKVCDKIMRIALNSALEAEDPKKVVDTTALTNVGNVSCDGFLMLFFVKDPAGGRGMLDIAGGEIPSRALAMLAQFYPHVFVKIAKTVSEGPGMSRWGSVPDLSVAQRIVLSLNGAVFLRWVDGGRGKMPLYVVRCGRHGLFLDTPHGYGDRFDCPVCIMESTTRLVEVRCGEA